MGAQLLYSIDLGQLSSISRISSWGSGRNKVMQEPASTLPGYTGESIARRKSPEEDELDKKLVELGALEAELAQCELDIATLKAELHAFDQRYLREVGQRYAAIDEIIAHIAQVEARFNPRDEQAGQRADETRARAEESSKTAGGTYSEYDAAATAKFRPSISLKKLFWEVAKLIHPDYALDETERARRNALMASATRAYAEGDEVTLRNILRDWQASTDPEKAQIATELVLIIRKIALVKERLIALRSEIAGLELSDLNLLRLRAEESESSGGDLLGEIAANLEEGLAQARRLLAELA
jgi:hypothetical protein